MLLCYERILCGVMTGLVTPAAVPVQPVVPGSVPCAVCLVSDATFCQLSNSRTTSTYQEFLPCSSDLYHNQLEQPNQQAKPSVIPPLLGGSIRVRRGSMRSPVFNKIEAVIDFPRLPSRNGRSLSYFHRDSLLR
jgi:hypothetical protein